MRDHLLEMRVRSRYMTGPARRETMPDIPLRRYRHAAEQAHIGTATEGAGKQALLVVRRRDSVLSLFLHCSSKLSYSRQVARPSKERRNADAERQVDDNMTSPVPLFVVPYITPQRIDRAEIPYGYEVWADGVYKLLPTEDADAREADRAEPTIDARPPRTWRKHLQRICDQPLWISSFAQVSDLTVREELVEISYIKAGTSTVARYWASRYDISENRRLVQLSGVGIPVRTGNSPQVETYLAKCFAANVGKLHESVVVTRLGRHVFSADEAVQGWMLGRDWIGPKDAGDVVLDPRIANDTAAAFSSHGDKDEWWRQYDAVVAANPITRLLIDATFTAPIMRFLNVRTFVLHHWAQSGSGKTALAKFAMSAWGDPQKILKSFNRTRLSFTEIFTESSDLPVGFDELQSADIKDFSTTIYAVTQETPRARANQYGGLQKETGSWRTLVRTTGEESLLGRSVQDLGGQTNRVVELKDELLTPAAASALHVWMDEGHHGHAGRWFLLKVVNRLNGKLEHVQDFTRLIKKPYTKICEAIRARFPNLGGRVQSIASIGVASLLVRYWRAEEAQGIITDPAAADARNRLWDATQQEVIEDCLKFAASVAAQEDETSTLPIHERALALLQDHCAANQQAWVDIDDPAQHSALWGRNVRQLTGVIYKQKREIWIIPAEGERLLRMNGIPKSRVLSDLRRYKILFAPTPGRYTVHREFGAFKTRVWVLRSDAFAPSDAPSKSHDATTDDA